MQLLPDWPISAVSEELESRFLLEKSFLSVCVPVFGFSQGSFAFAPERSLRYSPPQNGGASECHQMFLRHMNQLSKHRPGGRGRETGNGSGEVADQVREPVEVQVEVRVEVQEEARSLPLISASS